MALLSWQGQKVCLEDFQSLDAVQHQIQSFRDLASCFTHPDTKQYVLENKQWVKKAEHHLQVCQHYGIQLTWPGEKKFPKLLEYYKKVPALLSYKGTPCWNQHFQLCVVGSRKSNPVTLSWMDHFLSSFLKKHNINLLSGGARGIDQKGHSLALRAGVSTLCFLPCGLSTFYPSYLAEWAEPILKTGGAFISPFPPESSVRREFFHHRNSLMVRMSDLVFVLQAEERSGSMMTARLAGNFGVTLCVLPGPVMNPLFKGNLNLINDGVFMIRDDKDLETLYQAQTLSCLLK